MGGGESLPLPATRPRRFSGTPSSGGTPQRPCSTQGSRPYQFRAPPQRDGSAALEPIAAKSVPVCDRLVPEKSESADRVCRDGLKVGREAPGARR